MPRMLSILTLALILLTSIPASAHVSPDDAAIDIALLLDTSNSMDGLINQAKTQLWTIVQEFSEAKRHGCTPELRVALFEYGNTNLPAREGYIRQVVPLTDNLDVLSEALFSLTTQGGDEYCGQVIDEAITRLNWAPHGDHYRAVFIAGNEPFTQGGVDYRFACGRAVENSIVINTIHCGRRAEGIAGHWHDGAKLGKGEALNIDQDQQVRHIPCPQDDLILRLNEDLNRTYLWFGKAETRMFNSSNQSRQDMNAESLSPSVAVKRSLTKAGKMYSNVGRDLVDTISREPKLLEELDEDELPEQMRQMSLGEKKAHVQAKTAERQRLQAELARLNIEREASLQAELKRLADEDPDATLGGAIVKAIRTQLAAAGFDTP